MEVGSALQCGAHGTQSPAPPSLASLQTPNGTRAPRPRPGQSHSAIRTSGSEREIAEAQVGGMGSHTGPRTTTPRTPGCAAWPPHPSPRHRLPRARGHISSVESHAGVDSWHQQSVGTGAQSGQWPGKGQAQDSRTITPGLRTRDGQSASRVDRLSWGCPGQQGFPAEQEVRIPPSPPRNPAWLTEPKPGGSSPETQTSGSRLVLVLLLRPPSPSRSRSSSPGVAGAQEGLQG